MAIEVKEVKDTKGFKDFVNVQFDIYKGNSYWVPSIKKDEAKVHSDYATYLAKNKLGSDEEIFSLLEKAYRLDPTRMGVRNIYKYFWL